MNEDASLIVKRFFSRFNTVRLIVFVFPGVLYLAARTIASNGGKFLGLGPEIYQLFFIIPAIFLILLSILMKIMRNKLNLEGDDELPYRDIGRHLLLVLNSREELSGWVILYSLFDLGVHLSLGFALCYSLVVSF